MVRIQPRIGFVQEQHLAGRRPELGQAAGHVHQPSLAAGELRDRPVAQVRRSHLRQRAADVSPAEGDDLRRGQGPGAGRLLLKPGPTARELGRCQRSDIPPSQAQLAAAQFTR